MRYGDLRNFCNFFHDFDDIGNFDSLHNLHNPGSFGSSGSPNIQIVTSMSGILDMYMYLGNNDLDSNCSTGSSACRDINLIKINACLS